MPAIDDVVSLDQRGDIAVITIDSPPVNALSQPVRAGMAEAFKQANADDGVKGIVLTCAGRTFIAGADITEFGKPPKEPGLHGVLDDMESATKPIVAAIHGTALGGGLEVALTCHYRVGDPKARFGLPEVKLGLLPGAGGTQRLPRVLGVEKALAMITSGNMIGAKEALAGGLIEEIVEGDLTDGAVAFTEKLVAGNRELVKIRDRSDKIEAAKQNPSLFDDFRKKNARKFRGFEAPEACIQCIEAAVNLPFDEGLKRERELFNGLMQGLQSAAQRYFFFAEREAAKIPDVPKDTAMRPIKAAGVLGAGTMGGGISMNFANAGIPVTIVETSQEALDRGLGVIRKNYENTAKTGRISSDDVETRMGLITGTLDFNALSKPDIVIEAVFENMDLKKEIFAKLDGVAKPGAVLASNTSYLNVDEIASATKRPQDVVGMHFFSPANVMKLLEVVRGEKSAKDTIATAMGIGKAIGKTSVLVGVCHGFVGNRMLAQRQREAQKLILEGALPHQVDKVLYDFGLPMGPFQMSDMAGLDIGWSKETSTGSTIRERLCEADRRGLKTGAGYYRYEAGSRTPIPDPEVEKIILEFSEKHQIKRRQIDDQEILERCIYPMINEGAKILDEGIAIRGSDIDVVWVYGYGWPVYRGGPMFYADSVGLDKILARLEHYRAEQGEDWAPSPLLERLAKQGKGFRDL
ncbi:MAG: 3-hydroxyacyl-CoA dehydrogenase NAD-binding domain-containing protein [Alphaproteobacteria bacterium]